MLRGLATCAAIGSAVALAVVTTGCAGNAKSNDRPGSAANDVAQLQGTWQQQPTEGPAASPGERVVKQVSGNSETVTTYGADGKVINAHTAKFELERRGGVPVYTFYDRRITAGPEQGRSEGAARSYVYRLRGDEMAEVWGLLQGQEQREITVIRWRRVGQGQ